MFSIYRLEEWDRTVIRFHCPACGGREVDGEAWTRRESKWFLGLIPILFITNHWIRGSCCNTDVLSRVPPGELAELGADQIQSRGLLRKNLSVLALALTAFALVLCFLPALGMILSGAAF